MMSGIIFRIQIKLTNRYYNLRPKRRMKISNKGGVRKRGRKLWSLAYKVRFAPSLTPGTNWEKGVGRGVIVELPCIFFFFEVYTSFALKGEPVAMRRILPAPLKVWAYVGPTRCINVLPSEPKKILPLTPDP